MLRIFLFIFWQNILLHSIFSNIYLENSLQRKKGFSERNYPDVGGWATIPFNFGNIDFVMVECKPHLSFRFFRKKVNTTNNHSEVAGLSALPLECTAAKCTHIDKYSLDYWERCILIDSVSKTSGKFTPHRRLNYFSNTQKLAQTFLCSPLQFHSQLPEIQFFKLLQGPGSITQSQRAIGQGVTVMT